MEKIISGGQTGVDRAALDVAILLHMPHGGWCPLGRLAERGQIIPEKYSLQEASSTDFNVRTRLNIQNADATLIIAPRLPLDISDGTLFTLEVVETSNKPYLIVDINLNNAEKISSWIIQNKINILNIAGPRESTSPGIYQASFELIKKFLITTVSIVPITELYTGTNQQSHFRNISIYANSQQDLGLYSKQFPTNHIMFRDFNRGVVFDWHCAPESQYIIYLEGEVEVEVGCGEKRKFKAGDILFANDLSGQGHITRTITQGKSVIIVL